MIELHCPNCGHRFPAHRADSRGWCVCGMDYVLDLVRNVVTWTPDPRYTPDATETVVQPLEEVAA